MDKNIKKELIQNKIVQGELVSSREFEELKGHPDFIFTKSTNKLHSKQDYYYKYDKSQFDQEHIDFYFQLSNHKHLKDISIYLKSIYSMMLFLIILTIISIIVNSIF